MRHFFDFPGIRISWSNAEAGQAKICSVPLAITLGAPFHKVFKGYASAFACTFLITGLCALILRIGKMRG